MMLPDVANLTSDAVNCCTPNSLSLFPPVLPLIEGGNQSVWPCPSRCQPAIWQRAASDSKKHKVSDSPIDSISPTILALSVNAPRPKLECHGRPLSVISCGHTGHRFRPISCLSRESAARRAGTGAGSPQPAAARHAAMPKTPSDRMGISKTVTLRAS